LRRGKRLRSFPTKSLSVRHQPVPVDDLATEATHSYLIETVPELDSGDLLVETRIGRTSGDLAPLFARGETPLANDTSFGVGHAPCSLTERFVRTLEPRLHGEFEALARSHAASMKLPVDVRVNAADDYDACSVYLTTTGLSAEAGDDGAIGRGNRANDLITPRRPMSLEATAGKNPVTHVGKLYNLIALRIARTLTDELGVGYSDIQLVSRIGSPVSEPLAVEVTTTATDAVAVEQVVDEQLAAVGELTDALVASTVDVF